MKKFWKVFAVLVIGIVVGAISMWLATLIKIDIQTNAHYEEFEFAYMDNTMLGDMEYFKVIYYDEKIAQVYYVSAGMADANLLEFEKQGQRWVEIYWNTIWSDTGSASDVIWPYWWHFIYGGI